MILSEMQTVVYRKMSPLFEYLLCKILLNYAGCSFFIYLLLTILFAYSFNNSIQYLSERLYLIVFHALLFKRYHQEN